MNQEELKKRATNKHLWIGIAVTIVVILIVIGYFKYNEFYPSTDDAYVNANLVEVAPKVSAYIEHIYVKNNQLVKKGDLLFTLDARDYQIAADYAQKNYMSVLAQADMSKQQVDIQKKQIDKDTDQYNLNLLQANRYKSLYKGNTVSRQAYQSVMNDYNKSKIELEIDNKKYQQYINLYKMSAAKSEAAEANLRTAKANVNYTNYYSPINGYVTNLNSITVGDYVSSSQKIFGIVDNDSWWIDANFKETQLRRIKAGQKVAVSLDMYAHKYVGYVQSMSFASGNTFSLLPAQNATGNWVKITQRFTVRVRVDNKDTLYPLRVGSSAVVTIDTLEPRS